MAAKLAPTLNARSSRTDPRRDLRFAAYLHNTVYSNCAKFGKPALDSFLSYDELPRFDRTLYNNFKVSSGIHPSMIYIYAADLLYSNNVV